VGGELKVVELESARDLKEWLKGSGIDTSTWGKGPSKTVANLWEEYVRDEVLFQASPPLRIVQVVRILIHRDDRILVEVEQEFGDKQRRSRNQPPSEKIKAGEDHIIAAYRCLNEELGLSRGQINFVGPDRKKAEEIGDSPSYPGLLTRYTIYTVRALVNRLPDEAFWRENVAAGEGDPVRRHLWAWRIRS